jgi:hypothetical protein
LTSGEVTRITFDRVGVPPEGRSGIAVTKTTFASSAGTEIPSEGSTASVPLESDAPPDIPTLPEPEEEEEEPTAPAPPPDGAGTTPDDLSPLTDTAAIATGGSTDEMPGDDNEPDDPAATLIARLQAATSQAERMRALLPTPDETPENEEASGASLREIASEISSPADTDSPSTADADESYPSGRQDERGEVEESAEPVSPSKNSETPEDKANPSDSPKQPHWIYRAMLIAGVVLIIWALIHHRRRKAK